MTNSPPKYQTLHATNHKFNINSSVLNTNYLYQGNKKLKNQQHINNSRNTSREQTLINFSNRRHIKQPGKQQKFRNTKSNQKDYNLQRVKNREFQNVYSKKITRRESLVPNINNSMQKSAELLQKKSNSQPAKKFENNFRFRVYTNVFHKKSDPRIKQILQKQRKQIFLNNQLKNNPIGQVYQKIFYRKFVNIKPIPNTTHQQKIQQEDQISKRYIQNQIFTFQNQSLEFGYDDQIDKKQKKPSNHQQKKSTGTGAKNFRRKKFEKSAELIAQQINKDSLKYMESSNIDNKASNVDITQQSYFDKFQSQYNND